MKRSDILLVFEDFNLRLTSEGLVLTAENSEAEFTVIIQEPHNLLEKLATLLAKK